jgi:hypothetical protein
VIEPQMDMLTESGAFGNRLDVPEDASPQTKLLGLLGRQG